MARPKSDDNGNRLTAYLGVQLTPDQRARLEFDAAAAGLTLSEYARRRLIKVPIATIRRDPHAIHNLATALDRLSIAIDRVGVNLNQLAHHANRDNNLPALRLLRAWREELEAAFPPEDRKALMKKVIDL